MADNMQLISVSSDGLTWINSTPSAVSYSYRPLITNMTARTQGMDNSYVWIDTGNRDVKVAVSGYVDVNGLPYATTSVATFTDLRTPAIDLGAVWYIKIVDGSTDEYKDFELTETAPVWSATKNAYYNGGQTERYLHWKIYWSGEDLVAIRMMPPMCVWTSPNTNDTDSLAEGRDAIVPKYVINNGFKWRVKRVKQLNSNWDTSDSLCINLVSGQIIYFDYASDHYYIFNSTDLSDFDNFARPTGYIANKPEVIFWSRVHNCLVSYTDEASYDIAYYHPADQYEPDAGHPLIKTVNFSTSYNWEDIVSLRVAGTTELLMGIDNTGGTTMRIVAVLFAATSESTYQNITTPDIAATSACWNYDLDILTLTSDDGNNTQEMNLSFFDINVLYQVTGMSDTNHDLLISQLTYNPFTGGAFGLYKATYGGTTYTYLVELGI